MSQEIVFGSPQANPAMIVCKSPPTMRKFPSPALAPLYKQSAADASTTTIFGFTGASL